METDSKYIPALRFHRLTPLYDPLLRWVMREEVFKKQLVKQANIQPGQRVLDLGCGTGTLTILIKQIHPGAEVVGLDGDAKVLAIAREKAVKSGVDITWDQSMAFQMPYPEGSFDRVLSSLVFHHLSSENKRRTLAEICRILRSGGVFYMVDFGTPGNTWSRIVSPIMAKLEEATDNFKGLLPVMMQQAGFQQVTETTRYATLFGTLSLYAGQKPK
jgi:ubiquinone/menaquinone biosynthesis C-methylase UbiE